ncbi:MAG: hypothetical protein ACM3SQ_20425 [Betaproteobacteria bacterium]
MAITSVRCAVLGAQVSRITDLEGRPSAIICAEYDEGTGICRLKRASREGGPLSQFLERASEDSLSSPSLQCDLRS